ncbi:hypothetical protein NB693_24665 [Pantoea ananatis]|uniref:hypothetical protein n=1 Tax=Pantoea ananas TaxID=553 RepID=UPI002220E2C4|nr:hypothetical protein [Pantoea ananatis]
MVTPIVLGRRMAISPLMLILALMAGIRESGLGIPRRRCGAAARNQVECYPARWSASPRVPVVALTGRLAHQPARATGRRRARSAMRCWAWIAAGDSDRPGRPSGLKSLPQCTRHAERSSRHARC